MLRASFYLVFIMVLCASCLSNKKIVYFQSDKFSTNSPTLIENPGYLYQIQPSDILSIRVISTDQEATKLFNLSDPLGSALGLNQTSLYVNGYSVDKEGNINIPLVGDLFVKDKTVEEIQNLVEEALEKYLQMDQTSIIVRLVSFKVTVLGEVNRPGEYQIYNDRATIFEVLARGGDLRDFANRKSVKLLRRRGENTEVVVLDLTDEKILYSEYFYARPNDVIYVEPLKARIGRTNLPLISTVLTSIQITTLILNLVLSN